MESEQTKALSHRQTPTIQSSKQSVSVNQKISKLDMGNHKKTTKKVVKPQ